MKVEKILLYVALAGVAYFVYEKYVKGSPSSSSSSADASSVF